MILAAAGLAHGPYHWTGPLGLVIVVALLVIIPHLTIPHDPPTTTRKDG